MALKNSLLLLSLFLSACVTAPVPMVIQKSAPSQWVLKTPPSVPAQNVSGLYYHYPSQSSALDYIKTTQFDPQFKNNLILSSIGIAGPLLTEQQISNMVAADGGDYYIAFETPHINNPKIRNTTITVRATPSYQNILLKKGYITSSGYHIKDANYSPNTIASVSQVNKLNSTSKDLIANLIGTWVGTISVYLNGKQVTQSFTTQITPLGTNGLGYKSYVTIKDENGLVSTGTSFQNENGELHGNLFNGGTKTGVLNGTWHIKNNAIYATAAAQIGTQSFTENIETVMTGQTMKSTVTYSFGGSAVGLSTKVH